MNIRVFLVWLYAVSAACLSMGILFQLYRAARALADMTPILAVQELNIAALWGIGLFITFVKPELGQRGDGYCIGEVVRRVIAVGWLVAVVAICFFGNADKVMTAFGLWVNVALCFGLCRDGVRVLPAIKNRCGSQPAHSSSSYKFSKGWPVQQK